MSHFSAKSTGGSVIGAGAENKRKEIHFILNSFKRIFFVFYNSIVNEIISDR